MDSNTTNAYEDVTDSPVDYSKKYMERNVLAKSHCTNGAQTDQVCKKEFGEDDGKVDLFGDYAETDLDQPTNYSLRYAEDDTDEDEKQNHEFFPGGMPEDTIKTYCTEGTPYETPFNFSTATSMSDLREDLKENDVLKKFPRKAVIRDHKDNVCFKQKIEVCHDQESSFTKELDMQKSTDSIIILNSCDSVLKKPRDYYEEGTPTGFSRVNSLNSLNSITATQNNMSESVMKTSLSEIKIESEKSNHDESKLNNDELSITENNSSGEGKNNVRVVDKEGKVVTFCGHDYYAEQTPLMFSRCSSLGSLSGFEQHSIHDDRSSVVSDFSRRTSGIVSPSELPDSPTQTIPPSPRNQKIPSTEFVAKTQEAVRELPRRLLCSKSQVPKKSVFEDDIATFKEESTPIEFSTTTSLSSLIIDDEVKEDSSNYLKIEDTSEKVVNNSTDVTNDIVKMKLNVNDVEKDQEQVSDGDEDDDDMLAACISMGMQNNRYRQSFKTSSIQKPEHSESLNITSRYQRNVTLSRLEPHVSVGNTEIPPTTPKANETVDSVVVLDTVRVYCTEDTPADISPVGSQSNLSALSMPSVQEDTEKVEQIKTTGADCQRNDLSDESSNLSGDDEKILHECIQSGMPKVRQMTPSPASCMHVEQKSEVLPQKFNICGTPSSSPVESNHENKRSMLNKSVCCKSVDRENTFSDDSPNHSEDEAILSECIQSGMPKVRLNISSSLRSPILRTMQLATTTNFCYPSLFSNQSDYARQNENITKKSINLDDNVSLSEEEEEIILAQCIQSGMPKALNVSSTVSVSTLNKSKKYLKAAKIPTTSLSYIPSNSYSTKTVALNARLTHMAAGNDVSQRVVVNASHNLNHFSVKTSAGFSSGQSTKYCDTSLFEKMNISSGEIRTHLETANKNTIDNSFVTSTSHIANYRPPMFTRSNNDDVDDDNDDADNDDNENNDKPCPVVNKCILDTSRRSPVIFRKVVCD